MVVAAHAPALLPALTTGVGSLPHTDPFAAATFALRTTPRLPAIPQLPHRDPREQMLAQWLDALPEVVVAPDGSIAIAGRSAAAPEPAFDPHAHAGLLAFLEMAEALPVNPTRVKAQCTGPLTLATALVDAGMPAERAFPRAAELARAWVEAIESTIRLRLPASSLLLFLDEPSLVTWRADAGAIDRDRAIDVLSGVLASVRCTSGVHVCGDGDRRLALEAGPDVVGFDLDGDVAADGVALARFLDGDGWIAWGVVPADRPIGSSASARWRALVETWCDLTRRGCDPVRLRSQAIVTPSCGLAAHSPAQAAQVLALTDQIGERVHSQAVATRLTLGA